MAAILNNVPEAEINARLIAAAPETAAERDRLAEKNAALKSACDAVVREEARLRILAKNGDERFLSAWESVCSLAQECKVALAHTGREGA